MGREDAVLLLAGCPGRKQEVFAGPWEGRRAVLSFRTSDHATPQGLLIPPRLKPKRLTVHVRFTPPEPLLPTPT